MNEKVKLQHLNRSDHRYSIIKIEDDVSIGVVYCHDKGTFWYFLLSSYLHKLGQDFGTFTTEKECIDSLIKVLKKIGYDLATIGEEADRIKRLANHYLEASHILVDAKNGTGCVNVVCLALSLEVHLKYLLYLYGIRPIRGKKSHNTLVLFERLPLDIQKKIFSHKAFSNYQFSKSEDPQDTPFDEFKEEINTRSELFLNWRYAYEHEYLTYEVSFVEDFIEAIRDIAD